MASTFSPSLKLELIATGEQSGTWGATTNTNLGTLLEQAIAGFLSKAQGDVANLTLTSLDGASDEARNMVIDITGALTAARNVVVPTAEKFYLFKNSTTGGYAITVKTSGGSGVSIAAGTAQLVYCDGTNVVQGLSGTLAVQAAASVAITGGTIAGLTTLTMASGAATPATNDAAALGTSTLMWSDLFLASGGVINWNNGDVLVTHSANTLAFTGASSGYTYDAALLPSANDAAALGASATSWADLFLASGGVINFNAGNYTLTHSAGLLTANGAFSIGTSNALTAGTIELGAATDTTISRGAAGFIAVEGNRVPSPASQASGDILYRGTTEWERLAKGTAAQVLTMNAGATAPEWADAGGVDVQIFTSSGTWTKPATGTSVFVRAWGGGGSGGRAGSGDGGGGGGGGAYNEGWFDFSALGSTETVTIGAGGASRTADETSGATGGTTTFGSWLSAYGGGGGKGNVTTAGGGGGGGGVSAAGAVGGAADARDGGDGGGATALYFTTSTTGTSNTTMFVGGGGKVAGAAQAGFGLHGIGAGGGKEGSPGAPALGFGGGGGGGGSDVSSAAGAGGAAVLGGAGGGGGSGAAGAAGAGGVSTGGGNGGAGAKDANAATAGAQPGGGGGGSETGNSGAGGDGRVEVYVF